MMRILQSSNWLTMVSKLEGEGYGMHYKNHLPNEHVEYSSLAFSVTRDDENKNDLIPYNANPQPKFLPLSIT